MPIPIPQPAGTGVPTAPAPSTTDLRERPYYLREPQDWAISQERYRHRGALYHIGEWIFLVLMWHQLDFERGLVARCSRCYAGSGVSHRITAVYEQPTQNACPECFGTTFEGGYRARIVRPAIVADIEEAERPSARGMVHPAGVTFETTYDFRCRTGDYAIRADGSRWRVQSADRLQVRSGFQHASQADEAVAYKLPAALEDRASVAWRLPPTDLAQVRSILSQPMRFPGNFTAYEDLHGPLIPESLLD
jgi:hypothetical protein